MKKSGHLFLCNAQLAAYSSAFAIIYCCWLTKFSFTHFFRGFSPLVWIYLVLQVSGGFLVAWCVQMTSTVTKNYAQGLGFVLAVLMPRLVAHEHISIQVRWRKTHRIARESVANSTISCWPELVLSWPLYLGRHLLIKENRIWTKYEKKETTRTCAKCEISSSMLSSLWEAMLDSRVTEFWSVLSRHECTDHPVSTISSFVRKILIKSWYSWIGSRAIEVAPIFGDNAEIKMTAIIQWEGGATLRAGFRCHPANRVFSRQKIKSLYVEKSLPCIYLKGHLKRASQRASKRASKRADKAA